jgi:hypothetical protein
MLTDQSFRALSSKWRLGRIIQCDHFYLIPLSLSFVKDLDEKGEFLDFYITPIKIYE